MENANKALVMAASTLLAVMLFAIFTFFIKEISIWPEAQDEMLSTEQRTKFNEEYEVYEKSLMYGVDVISCLNKALSNNEKYERGEGFLSGDAYGVQYHIDVYVKIKTALEESLTVYYYNVNGRELVKYSQTDARVTMGNMGINSSGRILKFENLPDIVNKTNNYTSFYSGTPLYTQEGIALTESKFLIPGGGVFSKNGENGFYSLEFNSVTERENDEFKEDTVLKRLMSFSNNKMTQTIINSTKQNLDQWSSATWKTALYDFKTRRFTCEDINYNKETGLVDEVWFSEK